jgi:hypothetical protein
MLITYGANGNVGYNNRLVIAQFSPDVSTEYWIKVLNEPISNAK